MTVECEINIKILDNQTDGFIKFNIDTSLSYEDIDDPNVAVAMVLNEAIFNFVNSGEFFERATELAPKSTTIISRILKEQDDARTES